MSYTLRGRLESRLAALAAACSPPRACSPSPLHRWWPVELAALMAAVGLALDSQLYHRAARLPAGLGSRCRSALLELGALRRRSMRLAGIQAPLVAGARRSSRPRGSSRSCSATRASRSCGSPTRRTAASSAAPGSPRRSPSPSRSPPRGAVAYAHAAADRPPRGRRPPGPARDHRREVLVGEPGAVVRGGIVVRARGVTIRERHRRRRRERDRRRRRPTASTLDSVSVSGAKLDGIHVRRAAVTIRDCTIDMLGNPFGQGIDISYTIDKGTSMVEGCTVVGGQEGIVTHFTTAMIATTGSAARAARRSR